MDEKWRSSIWCKFAGVLSTTSTEASVLFMCLITIDRVLVIKFPFGQYRFNTRSAVLAASIGWIFALIIALFPIVYVEYFQDTFYSKSAVCLALPLTRDKPPGWLYSILIFIGFNLVTFVLIAVGQLLIYAEVKKHASVQKAMHVSRTHDLKVARNLLLVVTTDFLCWFPVGMMGVLALSGHVIPSEVYAWTAVLVLPVNSALNPFLYTLSAIIGKNKFTPSVDEHPKSESTKDMGKAVLSAFPYIAMRKGLHNNRLRSLAFLLQDDQLTVNDLLYVFYQIFKYEKVLHGVDLALKMITENDVLIQVGKTGNYHHPIQYTWEGKTIEGIFTEVQKKVQIIGNPDLYTSKKELANDIYQTGLLLKKALLALGR